MNNTRRKEVEEVLKNIQIEVDKIRELLGDLEHLEDEEQDAYDNLPESFQNGEKGEAIQTVIDALDCGSSDIDTMCDDIESAMNDLREEIKIKKEYKDN